MLFGEDSINIVKIVVFHSINIVKIVVFHKLVTHNLMKWQKLSDDCSTVVVMMLHANRLGKYASKRSPM
jgi:hypothetical protein